MKTDEPRRGEGYSTKVHGHSNGAMLSSRTITIDEILVNKTRHNKAEVFDGQTLEIEVTGTILDRVFAYQREGDTKYSRRLAFVLKDGRELQLPFASDVVVEIVALMREGQTKFKIAKNGKGYDARYLLVD
jgi:hypothetical protein